VALVPHLVPWQLRLFYANPMTLDVRVLSVCAAAVVVTTLFCSLFPALRASRTNLLDAFEGGARVAGSSPAARRARHVLQIIEVAATLILVTGTTLFATSFMKMATLDAGYDLDGLVSAGVGLPAPRYPGPSADAAFDRLIQSVRVTQGIRSATYGHVPPNALGGSYVFEGHDQNGPGASPDLTMMYVDPDYFDVLHIRLKAGRPFRSDDTAGGAPVLIIDAATAERYWPGESPLGKHVRLGRISPSSATIVGVVEPVKTRYYTSPAGTGELYIPNAQATMPGYRTLVVRGSESSDTAIAAVQRAVHAFDPSLDVKPQPVASYYEEILVTPRFYLVLTSVFAAVSLVTAAIGLFALLSYAVSERTREIGVRLALGAGVAHIRDALVPVAWGLAAGLVGAFWLTRYLDAQLFAVTTRDPRSYAIAVGMVVLVAAMAAYLPVRRATRIDPIKTLRE
jgi:predicted permease